MISFSIPSGLVALSVSPKILLNVEKKPSTAHLYPYPAFLAQCLYPCLFIAPTIRFLVSGCLVVGMAFFLGFTVGVMPLFSR